MYDTHQKIATSFSKAAKSYDKAAIVQHKIGLMLIDLLADVECQADNILDIGCGTGKITSQLAMLYPKKQIHAIDISGGMLDYARQHYSHNNIQWSYGDAKNLNFPAASIDIIFSNFTLQWCNTADAISQAAKVLTPGGNMIFSSVVAPSLHQLQHAWQQLDNQQHVNDFATSDQYLQLAAHNNLFVVEKKVVQQVEYFTDIYKLLSSLNKIGSVCMHNNSATKLNKALLHQLETNYRQQSVKDDMLPLSYYLLVAHLVKI